LPKQFSISVVLKAIDQISGPVHRVSRAVGGLVHPVRRVTNALRIMGRRALTAARKLGRIGRRLMIRIGLPLVAFGALSIRTAAKFQAAMNMVGAVTQATASQMNMMRKQALSLGASTQFTATQAAEGMLFLGKAGMGVSKIFEVMPATLDLAAAAQMDLGRAADIVTNVMAGFGLETSNLNRVNDALVTTFTSTNVDLSMLGQSMKRAGPVTKNFGMSIEEVVASLGLMGSAGIQGGMAGRAFSRAMTNLMNPTQKQAKWIKYLGLQVKEVTGPKKGSLRSMVDILKELEKAEKKRGHVRLAQGMMEIFGRFGGPTMMALLSMGSEELKFLLDEIDRMEGITRRTAEAQMRGLPGMIELVKAGFEAVRLAFMKGGVGDFINKTGRKLAEWMQDLSKNDELWARIAVNIERIAKAIGEFARGFKEGITNNLEGLRDVKIQFRILMGMFGESESGMSKWENAGVQTSRVLIRAFYGFLLVLNSVALLVALIHDAIVGLMDLPAGLLNDLSFGLLGKWSKWPKPHKLWSPIISKNIKEQARLFAKYEWLEKFIKEAEVSQRVLMPRIEKEIEPFLEANRTFQIEQPISIKIEIAEDKSVMVTRESGPDMPINVEVLSTGPIDSGRPW